MIELVDEKMVENISRILKYPVERIIWGQLFVAKRYWIRYRSKEPGIAELPYISFFRTVRFLDANKKAGSVDVINMEGLPIRLQYVPVILNYTIELMTAKVIEQNTAIRNFMLWAGVEGSISFKDADGVDWRFRVIPEDPEDNSDLEAEEELGRVVRTTFTVQVESMLLDQKAGEVAFISEVLTRVHGYYDNIDESYLMAEFKVPRS